MIQFDLKGYMDGIFIYCSWKNQEKRRSKVERALARCNIKTLKRHSYESKIRKGKGFSTLFFEKDRFVLKYLTLELDQLK